MFQKVKSFMTREIPIKWAFAFIAIILILFVLFNFSQYLTIPEWMLPNIFFAFITALFGFVFAIAGLYLRDHFEIRKMKKLRKLETLDAFKGEYSRCKRSIENSIEKCVEKNQMTDFVAALSNTIEMGEMRVSEQLQREIQVYNEKLEDYNIFRKTSETYIRNRVEAKVKRMFPKTLNKGYELHTVLCSDSLMARYFNGEGITENWFKEAHPIMLKNITKEIDESEKHELDILFNEMNNDFQKEDVLLRFRKQKETIIEQGKKIVKNLEKEISSIDEQLKKYDYMRVSELEKRQEIRN